MLPLRHGGCAPIYTVLIAASALLGEAAGIRAQAEQAAKDSVEVAAIQMIVPAAINSPATRAGERRDWTLRDAQLIVPVQASEEVPTARRGAGHAEVAVFSWRELVLAAIGVVVALGALLVFTGGGSPHRSRHP